MPINSPARKPALPTGMMGFSIVWFGQLISLIGSGMTSFGLTIWVWQETGQATALALVAFFSFAPTIFISPLAGIVIDRLNRKLLLVVSDLGAGLSTVIIFILYASGHLDVWHLYALSAWAGLIGAFQFPTFAAVITTMVSKQHYARANGMRSLANSAQQIAAPILAGILLNLAGIGSILVIDIITFSCAVLALSFVHIPQPKKPTVETAEYASFWEEALYGFRFLAERRGLFGLVLTFTALSFFGMIGLTVFAPMILARTSNNEIILGSVQSAIGFGGLTSGLLISLWGGFKRRIRGVFLGLIGGSLSLLGFGLAHSLLTWMITAFASFFFFPIIGASYGAIKQSKVPPRVQGKVFATDRLIQSAGTTFAILIAGPLADFIFGPAMMPGGVLSEELEWLVGTGPGSGMSLMLIFSGVLGILVGIAASLNKSVRTVEDTLPDYDDALV